MRIGDVVDDAIELKVAFILDINNIEVPLEYQKKLKGLDGEWEVFLEKLKDAVETLQTSKDQFG